jgi:hypothetical protein
MFNSVVLDVFIGLILIYLLYSLLITIVSEIVVSWIGLRSRMLRVSIEKMLNDGYYYQRAHYKRAGAVLNFFRFAWFIVQRFFLKEFPGFRTTFAGKFYEYPSIKYLAARGGEKKTFVTETKPSYFSDDIFADTLIQMLKDKGSGATDIEKVKFCLDFNTYMIEPATLKRMRDMAENAGTDINAFKQNLKTWFNETQDRASGWYKKKVQLILFWLGLIVAIIFNVDTLRIARILARDDNARDQLVNMGIELSKDSARYAAFLSDHDSTLPKAVLDSGYKRIIRDLDEANLVIGLKWGTDTLTKPLEKTIINSDESFTAITNQGSIFTASQQNIRQSHQSLLRQNARIDSALEKLSELEVNLLARADSVRLLREIDSIKKQLALFRAQKSRDSLVIAINNTRLNEVFAVINQSSQARFVSIHEIDLSDNDKIVIRGRRPYKWYEKLGYVLFAIFREYRFIGFFITALMLSLGAPFWFDLLKRFISMRGDGVKPEEKKVNNTEGIINQAAPVKVSPAPASSLSIVGDAVDEALKKYHDEIRKIPGVKTVFAAREKETKEKFIQVNVDSEATREAVLSKYPLLRVDNIVVKHKVVVSGVPVSNGGKEGTIRNISGKNGFGTLGCQLKRTDTGDFHILSCWHVMKGDRNYSETDHFDIIADHNDDPCAKRWAGGIRGAFDYGIARYDRGATENFNEFLKRKLGIDHEITTRVIDRRDIDEMIKVKYYDCLTSQVRRGILFANCAEVTVNYVDKDRVIRDVILITGEDDKSISSPGNSGSIIFDENNTALAMIISGDKHFTYAVRLSHIFSIHDEMIIA